MIMKNIICPVSIEKIDSNLSRLTIFINVVLLGIFLVNRNPFIISFVAIDYFIRAALNIKYSPVRLLAKQIISLFNLKKKPVGLSQKIFASRLGFLCAFAAMILLISGFPTTSFFVALALMLLSFMDSVLNFCVGCLIYNYLVYPFYKNKNR
jgi:hypothetical protein